MKLTPDDIRNQLFKTQFKGFDKEDVLTYLQLVADDLEIYQRESALLKDQLKKLIDLSGKLQDHIKTQSQDKKYTKEEAMLEGEKIIQKARNQAREIREVTAKEAYEMENKILQLEARKNQLMKDLK